MARRHKGHFSAKHPVDTTVETAVEKAVVSNLTDNQIPCTTAFGIADHLSVTPMVVGTAIDLQEGRIVGCQLGLFGYGKQKKLLDAPQKIDKMIQRAIQDALVDGRLSCLKAWQIADAHTVPRLEIANICESLNIRICQCQLGAF